MTTETKPVTNVLYPQTKLSIEAVYRDGDGERLPAGMPEIVKFELNDELPGDLLQFVNGIIATLFRHGPADGITHVSHNMPPQPFGTARAEVPA